MNKLILAILFITLSSQSFAFEVGKLYSHGNVGIGSANPGQILDVQGTIRTTSFTMSTSATTGYVLTAQSGSGNAIWSPSAGGGSGTVTSITLATPNSTLTLGGTNPITTSGTINADINLSNNNTWTGLQNFTTANVGIGSTNPGKSLDVQGTIRGLGEVINGNVGIGSANPGQILDVNGTIRSLGTTPGISIGTTAANANYLNVGTTDQFTVSSTGVVNSGTITSTGNLLSSSNIATMGSSSATAGSKTTYSGGGSTTSFVAFKSTSGAGTTADSIQFDVGNNGGTEAMRIQDNSGTANIGIGTSIPSGNLDVEGTISPVVFFAAIPATGTNKNVGIGSFNPGQLLDVQGTVRMSKLGTTLSIASGTNGCQGQATLSGGTVTVSTACTPTASQGIFLQDATTGSLVNVGTPTVGTVIGGTSFVINSSNALDASNVNWWILKSS